MWSAALTLGTASGMAEQAGSPDSVSCVDGVLPTCESGVRVPFHIGSHVLPAGWVSGAWQGGWIMGVALEEWELSRAPWPHTGSRDAADTVQVLLGDGTVESSFERQGRAGRAAKLITQMGEQPPPSEPVLPQSWAAWYERVAAASGIDAAAVGAYPYAAELPDSLAWLAESSWMTCAVDGVVLRAYAGRDSAAAVQRWDRGERCLVHSGQGN